MGHPDNLVGTSTVGDLTALLELLQAQGVREFRRGDLVIVLGPRPLPPVKHEDDEKMPTDDELLFASAGRG